MHYSKHTYYQSVNVNMVMFKWRFGNQIMTNTIQVEGTLNIYMQIMKDHLDGLRQSLLVYISKDVFTYSM